MKRMKIFVKEIEFSKLAVSQVVLIPVKMTSIHFFFLFKLLFPWRH